MKDATKSEYGIVILLCAIALCLNIAVWVGKLAQIDPGHTYIPIHNSLSDYSFYVSVVRQGVDGSITVFNPFATETHEGSVIHFFYLAIGMVARSIGVSDAHIAYHASRYVLGIIWCIAIYRLITLSIREKWQRILALAFSLFSASFPRVVEVLGAPVVTGYMTWWSELDPVVRAAFIPHFTMGHIMMVSVFISVLEYVRFQAPKKIVPERTKWAFSTWWHRESRTGKRWLVRVAVAAWIAAFVHPPSAIQILLIIPLIMVIIRSQRMIQIGFASLVGAGSGLGIINSVSAIFPWNLARAFEGWSFALSVPEYLLALGPVVFFAIIGMIAIFVSLKFEARSVKLETNSKQTKGTTYNGIKHISNFEFRISNFLILLLWIVTSIVMIPLSKLMPFSPFEVIRTHPISNIRFLQVAVWVPLSILGAVGFSTALQILPSVLRILVIAAMVVLTFVGYPSTVSEQIAHVYFGRDYQYPDIQYVSAIRELGAITKPGEAIMSLSLAGMTIPTYVNRSVYVGQVVYTPELDKKLAVSWSFFAGTMSPCEAYMLVKTNNIKAVFFSADERQAGNAVSRYLFLQPWNTFGMTTVYTVVDVPPIECG